MRAKQPWDKKKIHVLFIPLGQNNEIMTYNGSLKLWKWKTLIMLAKMSYISFDLIVITLKLKSLLLFFLNFQFCSVDKVFV